MGLDRQRGSDGLQLLKRRAQAKLPIHPFWRMSSTGRNGRVSRDPCGYALLISEADRRASATVAALLAVVIGVAGCGSGAVQSVASNVTQARTSNTASVSTPANTQPKTSSGAAPTTKESSTGSSGETATIAEKTTPTSPQAPDDVVLTDRHRKPGGVELLG